MAALLIALVKLYRWVLSPVMRFLLGGSGACRFTPTCSCYAEEALRRHGFWRGARLTGWRLLRCHPWGSSGYDPVPGPPSPNLNPNPAPNLKITAVPHGFGGGGRFGVGSGERRRSLRGERI